jgi:hypothetical protein
MFDIWAFYRAANGSNWLNVAESTISLRFSSLYKYEMWIPDDRWSFFFIFTNTEEKILRLNIKGEQCVNIEVLENNPTNKF